MNALNIAKLKIKLLFYSPKNVVSLFIFPLLLIYLIGYIYSPQTLNQVPIAIVDEDNSEYSQRLISLIKENGIISVIDTTDEKARELIRKNKIEGAYVIKEGFQNYIKVDKQPSILVLRSPAAVGANSISEIITSGVVRLQSNSRAANIIVNEYKSLGILTEYDKDKLWQEVFDTSESYWYPEQLMKLSHRKINVDTSIDADESSPVVYQLSDGPLGIILMFLALSLGYVFSMIIKDKNEGTFKRVFLIAGSRKDILLGYLYSMVCLLIIQSYFLIFVSDKIFNISFDIPKTALFLLILLYCVYISAIVLAIGIGVNGASNLNNYYSLGAILTSIIGGSFWSTELIPSLLQRIALITPQGLILHMLKLTKLGEQNQILMWSIFLIVIISVLLLYSSRKLSIIIKENIF